MQAFATELLSQYPAAEAPSDPTRVKLRLGAGLTLQGNLGSRRAELIDSLLAYWSAVVDLVQRQEHGADKEGDPLTWEDGRSVVLQTLVTIAEVRVAVAMRR